MAAPSSTVWGSVVQGYKNGSLSSGRKGKIGIYTNVSSTATQTTVEVEVWFWTIYSCSDGYSNTFYYDIGTGISSATTAAASNIDITHTVETGSGWSTSNQTKLYSWSKTYTRGTSATTYKIYSKFTGIDMLCDSSGNYRVMTANTSFTVPKLASYTIKYDANGGTGAPSSQTKYYGKSLTISSTKPTRTGYTFLGWALTATGSVYYASGSTCGKNENLTLYAVWEANTYDVKFNANGGSGAPSSQTKTYDVDLKLSATVPTRTNYNFLGWGTSASSTTVAYAAGANYTKNTAITLYAIWELAYVKPRITGLTIARCDADGNSTDSGTYLRFIFDWASDQSVSSIALTWESSSDSGSGTVTASGTSGSVDTIVGGSLNAESTYTVSITVTDAVDYTTIIRTVNGTKFIVDFKSGGTGIAFGKSAELDDVCDIGFKTRLFGGLEYVVLEPETDLNDIQTPNFYIGANITNYNYVNCPLTTGTFALEVASMGEDGQVKQRLTYCHKTASRAWERIYYQTAWGEWVCVSDFDGQLLWEGGMYMTAGHTATLAEPVSQQNHGIVLVFSEYVDGATADQSFHCRFVPKKVVSIHDGKAQCFQMSTSNLAYFATKYLYITDTQITGHANNNATGTGTCGITYTNNRFVLRYVIGV